MAIWAQQLLLLLFVCQQISSVSILYCCCDDVVVVVVVFVHYYILLLWRRRWRRWQMVRPSLTSTWCSAASRPSATTKWQVPFCSLPTPFNIPWLHAAFYVQHYDHSRFFFSFFFPLRLLNVRTNDKDKDKDDDKINWNDEILSSS